MKFYFLLPFLLVFAWLTLTGGCCCEPPPGQGVVSPDVLMQGKWEWLKRISNEAVNDSLITPQSCGCTESLQISPTTITTYHSGRDSSVKGYTIRRGLTDSALAHGNTELYIWVELEDPRHLTVTQDSLILERTLAAGVSDWYVRVR